MISLIKRTSSAVTSRFTPSPWPLRNQMVNSPRTDYPIVLRPQIKSYYSTRVFPQGSVFCFLFSVFCFLLGFLDSWILGSNDHRPLIATSFSYLLPFAFQPDCHRTDIFVLHPRLFQSLSRSSNCFVLFSILFQPTRTSS